NAVTHLEAGQYVVVVKNRAAFVTRYPNVANIAGEYSGNLDNSGERIVLEGPFQEVIADFRYEPGWYPSTDDLWSSLVLANENALPGNWSDPAAWRPSSLTNRSPGRPDPSNTLQIQSARIDGADCVLQFQGSAGQSYSVLYSDSLPSAGWLKLNDFPVQ